MIDLDLMCAAPIGDVYRSVGTERDLLWIFEPFADDRFHRWQILEFALARERLPKQLVAGEDEQSTIAIKGEPARIRDGDAPKQCTRLLVLGGLRVGLLSINDKDLVLAAETHVEQAVVGRQSTKLCFECAVAGDGVFLARVVMLDDRSLAAVDQGGEASFGTVAFFVG